jgi:hypothetical protein
MQVATYSFGLLIVVTLVVVYFPVLFIRKANKILEALGRIESNTRKP